MKLLEIDLLFVQPISYIFYLLLSVTLNHFLLEFSTEAGMPNSMMVNKKARLDDNEIGTNFIRNSDQSRADFD